MMLATTLLTVVSFGALNAAQLITDSGVYGPALELVHLYYDEFPTGKSLRRSELDQV